MSTTTTAAATAAAVARLLSRGILPASPLKQQQCTTSAAAAAALAWVGGSGSAVCERRHRCRCSRSSETDAQHQQHQHQQHQQQQPPGWRTQTAAHASAWLFQGLPAWQLQQQRAHSSTADPGSSSSSSSPQQPDATPAGTAGGAPAGAEPDEDEVYLDDELQLDEGEEPLLPADHVTTGSSAADLGGGLTQTSLDGGGEDSADEFEVILDAFEEFDEGFAWEDEEGVEDELTVRFADQSATRRQGE